MIFIYLVVEISETEAKLALVKKGKEAISSFEKFACKKDELKNILPEYLKGRRVKKVILVLKDDKIFKKFEVAPLMEESDIKRMIDLNQKSYFPINLDEYIIDYKILHKSKKELFLMIVAVSKSTISEYIEIFESLSLEIILIDFYQNVVGEVFSSRVKEKSFIINSSRDRFVFTYIMSGYILNIREIPITSESDALRAINKSFGFYKNEIYDIKNLIFLDDIPVLKSFFEGFRANIYTNIEEAFELNRELLSFIGISERV